LLKVCTIVGARPQFVKASAVSKAFSRHQGLTEVLIHTGQHYDDMMSDVFFKQLEIPKPRYNLGIGSSSHGKQTGQMIEKIENILLEEKPDCVLVYGDTNSTLAGALAAVKLHIPIAHVEAGLRSFNRRMPEEINRILTDHSSDLLFTPTALATKNLHREGIYGDRVLCTGDVMLDVALWTKERLHLDPSLGSPLMKDNNRFALATIHRAESTDQIEILRNILSILGRLSSEISIVWPIHPRTRAAIDRAGLRSMTDNITMIEPVGYFPMTDLILRSSFVVTDSGGLQKEAFFHGKPCATLRTETEWVELVEAGWNQLIAPSSDPDEAVRRILCAQSDAKESQRPALYGDGAAGSKIVEALYKFFQ
jgi:UDP-GlcNAc3NAcA epimerase